MIRENFQTENQEPEPESEKKPELSKEPGRRSIKDTLDLKEIAEELGIDTTKDKKKWKPKIPEELRKRVEEKGVKKD